MYHLAAECRVIRVVNDKGSCLYEWSHGYIFKNITFFASTWINQQQLSISMHGKTKSHNSAILFLSLWKGMARYQHLHYHWYGKKVYIGQALSVCILACKTTNHLRWTWFSAVAVDDVNKIIWYDAYSSLCIAVSSHCLLIKEPSLTMKTMKVEQPWNAIERQQN